MAANVSQSLVRSMVLASPAGDFATWRMIVTCRGCCTCRLRVTDCGRCPASVIPMSRLPPAATVARALQRLRCARCGSRADRELLDNDAPGWRRRSSRLWGRGSHA